MALCQKKSFFILLFLFFTGTYSSDSLTLLEQTMQGTTFSYILITAYITIFQGLINPASSSSSSSSSHIDQGNKLLAGGQFSDALHHYHQAIELDPDNYLTYFRRATVFLALGKSKSALPDLDMVLKLKPDFTLARMQRANVKLKQGKIKEAELDFQEVLSQDNKNEESRNQLNLLPTISQSIDQSKQAAAAGDISTAVQLITPAVEACIWDPELYQLRSEWYEQLGDINKAIQDIRPTTKLINDNTNGFLKLSLLLYLNGEVDESLKEIRECLKLDSDHKSCHNHYKKVKKLSKTIQSANEAQEKSDYEKCIKKAGEIINIEKNVFSILYKMESLYCYCYLQLKDTDKSLKHCNIILEKHNPSDVEAFINRAETYILQEKYEEAINDYKRAEEINGGLRKVNEGLKKAQKLLKQSKKRDYYKILGVKRTANKREILKAYRKLAAQWHPDQYKEGTPKEEAEKKFIDIAAAKEVLTDQEKRDKFDQGEDPLDPEQQGGGHEWHQGFNPFEHGGFQFKFHFG